MLPVTEAVQRRCPRLRQGFDDGRLQHQSSVPESSGPPRDEGEGLHHFSTNDLLLLKQEQHQQQLLFSLQEVKACIEDLNKLLSVEPKNTAALKLLQEVQKRK